MRERTAWKLAGWLDLKVEDFLESLSDPDERKFVERFKDEVVALAALRLWALRDRRKAGKLWVLLERMGEDTPPSQITAQGLCRYLMVEDVPMMRLLASDLNLVTNYREGE